MTALHICWIFVSYTSIMQFSHCTTFQKGHIELRSGDCRGHLSIVKSLLCSKNQIEMIWVLTWCSILLEEAIRRWEYCGNTEMDMVSISTKQSSAGTNSVPIKYSPHYLTCVDTMEDGSMFSCLNSPNVNSEPETHQSSQWFSIFCCLIWVIPYKL